MDLPEEMKRNRIQHSSPYRLLGKRCLTLFKYVGLLLKSTFEELRIKDDQTPYAFFHKNNIHWVTNSLRRLKNLVYFS